MLKSYALMPMETGLLLIALKSHKEIRYVS